MTQLARGGLDWSMPEFSRASVAQRDRSALRPGGCRTRPQAPGFRTNGDVEEYWRVHVRRDRRRVHQSGYFRNSIRGQVDAPGEEPHPKYLGDPEVVRFLYWEVSAQWSWPMWR